MSAEELEALRQKYIAETNPAKKALIKQQFEKLEKEAPSLVNYNEWTKGWLLPLGAAFMQEMKKLQPKVEALKITAPNSVFALAGTLMPSRS